MNPKQAAPLVATAAPVIAAFPGLLVIGGLAALAIWLVSDDDKKKLETIIPADSAAKPCIPANSVGKSYVTSAQPPCVPAAPTIQIPLPLPKIPARRIITLENMKYIFNRGDRKINRKSAVTSLIGLGFGKSAAYEALLENGRFSTWLQFEPDGMIIWKC